MIFREVWPAGVRSARSTAGVLKPPRCGPRIVMASGSFLELPADQAAAPRSAITAVRRQLSALALNHAGMPSTQAR